MSLTARLADLGITARARTGRELCALCGHRQYRLCFGPNL